jgi:hypothetical protein
MIATVQPHSGHFQRIWKVAILAADNAEDGYEYHIGCRRNSKSNE